MSKAEGVTVSIDETAIGRWSRLKKARKDRASGDIQSETVDINQGRKGAHGAAAPVAVPVETSADYRPWLPPLTEGDAGNVPEIIANGETNTGENDQDEALNDEERAIAAEMNLPDIDTLEEESDFRVFMSDGVPDKLRRLALRKLWSSNPLFGFRDGLNDYDEDFTMLSDFVYNTTAMSNFKESGKLPESETDKQVAEVEEDREAPGDETDQPDSEEISEPETVDVSDSSEPDEEEPVDDADPELG